MGKSNKTVLVVNDLPDILELLSRQVSQLGYRALTASDGREGFQIAQLTRPDLIISDISMPRTDGIEMCRRIRAHPLLRTRRVLLVTAADRGTIEQALNAGANDYLSIPYDRTVLAAKIAALLAPRHVWNGPEPQDENRLNSC